MLSFPQQVASNIRNRRLLSPHEQVLVAVSGGLDSMVLLDVLHELANEAGWKLTVAHLNHQLRGGHSLADERLVRRTATQLGLPLIVSRADVRGFAKASGLSLEMSARKLRHDFLARTARECQIAKIALAHHLDDQVELFFLRLFRGSGPQGLSGMKPVSPSPSNSKVTLVRPLLDFPKSTLRKHAIERKIRFREDASNASLDIQRNRIRHELLPLLERHYQPGLARNILRVMDILGAESEFVNAVAGSWLARKAANPKRRGSNLDEASERQSDLLNDVWGLAAFEALPLAVQRRCLQLELIRQGIMPDYHLVEHLRLEPEQPIEIGRDSSLAGAIRKASRSDSSETSLALSSVRLMRKPQGIVRVSPVVTAPFGQEDYRLDLFSQKGQTDWQRVRFAWRVTSAKRVKRLRPAPQTEFFDADAVGPSIILRHWRPGDRFQPIGMTRAAKLQDLFVNQKVPREQRHTLVVATTAHGELFWVEGLRISERFKLTNSTIRRLHWAWQRL